MNYIKNEKRNFLTNTGLGICLVGVVVYDPLGLLFKGTGLAVIGLGLICMFLGYKQSSEVEAINQAVEKFENND